MKRIGPPESHYVNAALGWLELNKPTEAAAELDSLSSRWQSHPDVLEIRWMLLAAQQKWDAAAKMADALVEKAPGRSSGWLHRAYAVRRMTGGSLQQAWNVLLPAADRFPKEVLIPYNLACYACQMQRLEEARTWLRRALETGSHATVRAMALRDEDLRPLWAEIQEW